MNETTPFNNSTVNLHSSTSTNPIDVRLDATPLLVAIATLQTSLTETIKGIGNTFSGQQTKFNDGLSGAVKAAVKVAQDELKGFVTSSFRELNKQSTTVTRNGKGEVLSETTTTVQSKQNTVDKGLSFDQKFLAAHQEYNKLVADQKKTFGDFTAAITKVTDRFMSFSGLLEQYDVGANLQASAQQGNTTVEGLLTTRNLIKALGGGSEQNAEFMAVKVHQLLDKRNSSDDNTKKEFTENKIVQAALANNPAFRELAKNPDANQADLAKEFAVGVSMAYSKLPESKRGDFKRDIDRYIDPNTYLKNYLTMSNPEGKSPKKPDPSEFNNNENDPGYKAADAAYQEALKNYELTIQKIYPDVKKYAKERADHINATASTAVETSLGKDRTDTSNSNAAEKGKPIAEAYLEIFKFLHEKFPETIAYLTVANATADGVVKLTSVLGDFKELIVAILGVLGIGTGFKALSKLINSLRGGPGGGPGIGGGGLGGGGLGGGGLGGCCCPFPFPVPAMATAGAGARNLNSLMLGAAGATALATSPDAGMAPNAAQTAHESSGQPSHILQNLLLTAGVAGIVGMVVAAIFSGPVLGSGLAAAGIVGLVAGSDSAEAKGKKTDVPKNRGLLEYNPPQGIIDDDGLGGTYIEVRPNKRGSPVFRDPLPNRNNHTSNAFDMGLMNKTQNATQNITTTQTFHINIQGDVTKDPALLKKAFASTASTYSPKITQLNNPFVA